MLFAPNEKGQGMVEQALLLVLVAIVAIAVLMIMGPPSVMSSVQLIRASPAFSRISEIN